MKEAAKKRFLFSGPATKRVGGGKANKNRPFFEALKKMLETILWPLSLSGKALVAGPLNKYRFLQLPLGVIK